MKINDIQNTFTPEGAQRCRALTSSLLRLVGGSKRTSFRPQQGIVGELLLETPAGKIYIVCDSVTAAGFTSAASRDTWAARAAILPIGAYEPRWFMKDQHMNPADAVKALADCGAELALAHHHGTFQLTDEAIDAPEKALAVALDEAGVPRERFVALKPGQVMEI